VDQGQTAVLLRQSKETLDTFTVNIYIQLLFQIIKLILIFRLMLVLYHLEKNVELRFNMSLNWI
jgi:hypothetical protein